MESPLEDHRQLHEERERIENVIIQEMIARKNSHRDQINSDNRVKYLLEVFRIQSFILRF